MAESTTIADLLVSLGVKADPSALATLEKFDALTRSATSAVRSFAKVAASGASSIAALGASASSLAPLVEQLGALQERLSALKGSGLTKLTLTAGSSGDKSVDRDAERAEKAAAREVAAAEKAAAREVAAAEKVAAAKQKAAKAEEAAIDKAVLAELRAAEKQVNAAEKAATREQNAWEKARHEAAMAAERQAQAEMKAWQKSATEAEKAAAREAAALAKVAAAEEKVAKKAAEAAMAKQKADEEWRGANSLFGSATIANFTGAMGIAVGVIEQVAKVAAVAAVSVAALGTALAANSLAVAQDALQVERQAVAVGLTVEKYQELRYALGRFGVDSRDLADLFGQFSQQIVAAAEGSKTVGLLFEKLGLDAKKLVALSPDQQLAALADAMRSVENPTERLAIASSLLGEDLAKKLTPLLVQGSGALADLQAQAESLGIVLSQDDVEASRKLTSQWAELTGMADGLRIRLGTSLIPVLSDLATRLIDWYDANKDVIDQKFEATVAKIADAFVILGDAGESLNRIFGGPDGFFKSAGKLYDIAAALASVGKYVAIVTAALYPVTALGAAFTAVGLAAQDFYTYITGGTSVMGTVIDQFGETDTLLGAMIRLFQALGSVASAAFNLLSVGFMAAWNAAAPLRDVLSSIAEVLGGAMMAGINVLIGGLTDFINLLAQAANGWASLLGSTGAIAGAQAVGGAIPGIASAGAGALVPGATGLASVLAPSASAPVASKGAATIQVSIGGNTISGLGLTKEQTAAMLADHSETQQRQLQQSLQGLNL